MRAATTAATAVSSTVTGRRAGRGRPGSLQRGVGLAAELRLDLGGALVVLGLDGGVELLAQRGLVDGPGRVEAQLGGGLVDQVDGLVGQVLLGQVAVAQARGGDQRVVLDDRGVVLLVGVAQAAEDLHGLLDAGGVDGDRREAARQRGVALDALVLAQRRGADHPQLAAGEHRLEQVGGVHRALGAAGAQHGVELVEEQDDLALGGADLGEHGLQPLLELAAELAAGDEAAQVEGDDARAAQRLGDVALGDAQREALDDRGLADAGLADQHGVVLAAAGEDLDRLGDLGVAADDGIDAAVARVAGEVAAELVQRGGLGGVLLALGAGARLRGACAAEDGLAHRDAGAGASLAAGPMPACPKPSMRSRAQLSHRTAPWTAGLGLDDHVERAGTLGADGAGHGGGEGLVWHVS